MGDIGQPQKPASQIYAAELEPRRVLRSAGNHSVLFSEGTGDPGPQQHKNNLSAPDPWNRASPITRRSTLALGVACRLRAIFHRKFNYFENYHFDDLCHIIGVTDQLKIITLVICVTSFA